MHSRVLVCGGRDISDSARVYADLDRLNKEYGPFETVVEGDARGVDRMAGYWARKNGMANLKFPADWKAHGRGAGHVRNTQMLAEGKPELVIAFPGGTGAANMMKQAKAADVRVIAVAWATE